MVNRKTLTTLVLSLGAVLLGLTVSQGVRLSQQETARPRSAPPNRAPIPYYPATFVLDCQHEVRMQLKAYASARFSEPWKDNAVDRTAFRWEGHVEVPGPAGTLRRLRFVCQGDAARRHVTVQF